MRGGSKLIALIVALAVMVSALSGAFLALAVDPVPYQPLTGNGSGLLPRVPDNQTVPTFGDGLDVEKQDKSPETLFLVRGNDGLGYLRCAVFNDYEDGYWAPAPSNLKSYSGGELQVPIPENAERQERSITIEPVKYFDDALPAAKDAISLNPAGTLLLEHDQGSQTFKTLERTRLTYTVDYYATTYTLSTLQTAQVVKDPIYLQVPADLYGRLETMAHFVVGNLTAPYEQVMALQEYLKSSYIYSQDFPAAHGGVDPVADFLFNTKMGVCGHFNTALVLMCRTMGLPARMVGGYHISPYADYMEVKASMVHAYAEVRFEGQGWMIFDATPTIPTSPEQVRDDTPTPEVEKKANLWGHVFDDLDKDKVRDTGEPGMGQASLYLEDRPGNITMRTSTIWNGVYIFKNISYGRYVLGIILDEGWMNSSLLRVPVIVGDNLTERPIDFSMYYDSSLMNGTIPTVTNITNSALSTIKGRNFTVEGTVLDYQGHKVPDMLVRIYLALGKEGNRSLCGIGEAIKGSFNVTCLIPQNLAPGDYQLIARSISNFVFQGSSSDPVIRVMDGTSIVFTGAQKVVEGVVSLIQVALVYNSTGEVVSGAKLSATGYKEIGLVSGVYAMDRLVISTGQAGNYSVHIAYAGNDHLLSSSGDFVLHAAKVTVDVDHDDLVRGRDNIVACRMHAEEIPIGNTLIFVTLADGVVISDLYTSGNGMFALSAPMPSDHPLQNMSVTYRLFNGPFYESSYRVTAATEIQSKVAEDRIELRLVEDSGAPLADKPILVKGPEGIRNYSTDESGQVVLSVGRGTESNYTVSFSGEAFLQPASALVHHPASYVMPLNYVAVFFLAGIMAASGYYYYRKRPNVRELIASILPARPAAPKGPYKVRFPDIPEGLPAVWSQSPLLVELEGKARELQLWVDDVPLQTLTLEHGRARAPVLLGKGTHRLSARGSQGISECEVRIVDYREEVVGLYKHTFVRLMSSTPGLSPDMTPREAQRMLEGRIGIDRYGDLETMTSLFERANFSLAPVGRREYESMFLSTSRVSA